MTPLKARAVIFDLDGVLLDTEPLYSQATQAVIGRFGKEYTFDIKVQTMGRDANYGADLLLRTLGLPLSRDEYLAERRRHLLQLFPHAQPLAGAPEFVAQLAETGVPLAIATSSSRQLADIKLAPHDFMRRFRVTVCGDDPRVGALKPDPDIFFVAAGELGVPIDECVIFEDSPAGIEAGLRSGAQVVALPDPRLPENLSRGAAKVVHGYDELGLEDFEFIG